MRDDGSMARIPDLIDFCGTHNLKMLTVAELIRYRMQHERYVHRVGEALVSTRHGEFRLIAYESEIDGGESHVALVRGDTESGGEPVLVRMHSHCLRSEEHTSELQSPDHLVCRLLLEKKNRRRK